jgi:putative FmdB family regulatory protein
MPIYEYACRQCGHNFESLVLHNSSPAECPVCRAGDPEQLVSLCGMSTESSRQTNLAAAHKRAGAVREAKQRDQHQHLHEHFEDRPAQATPGSKNEQGSNSD